jgi:hypothetical protein
MRNGDGNEQSEYKINLPVVLHACETWPLTLRDDHECKMFENWSTEENICIEVM